MDKPKIDTVQDLINELSKFPLQMKVRTDGYFEIEKVVMNTWVDNNYPYNRPDEDFVSII